MFMWGVLYHFVFASCWARRIPKLKMNFRKKTYIYQFLKDNRPKFFQKLCCHCCELFLVVRLLRFCIRSDSDGRIDKVSNAFNITSYFLLKYRADQGYHRSRSTDCKVKNKTPKGSPVIQAAELLAFQSDLVLLL